jgi:hypothetical protein
VTCKHLRQEFNGERLPCATPTCPEHQGRLWTAVLSYFGAAGSQPITYRTLRFRPEFFLLRTKDGTELHEWLWWDTRRSLDGRDFTIYDLTAPVVREKNEGEA